MNIVLISTDTDTWALGMRSISGSLLAAGHLAKLIFMSSKAALFSRETLSELAELVQDADIIGFSTLAQGSEKAKQAIEFLRPLKKLIVWGGVHASLDPGDCADWADIVCRGEGEGMIIELIDRLTAGKEWKDIQNIAYKENGILHLNSVRPPISNLDDLPIPDYAMENEYHLFGKRFKKISALEEVEKNGVIAFNSSRGCAFYCTYCCNGMLKDLYSASGHYVRRMSISRLIEHTKNLREIFPNGKFFYFIDEDFTARPINELVQFAEEFPLKVGLPFECLAHPARISQPKMDLLVKAGLWRIRLGIESGSERTKKEIYNRRVTNEAALKACKIISNYPQISATYFFIISNPYENRADLVETIQLISSFPPGSTIQAFDLIFFPGSALYDRAVSDGLIEGKKNCGYEIDYRNGLHYKGHSWKKRNLYLNGILYLMDGRCSRQWLGNLPRFLLNYLLRDRVIEFNDRHGIFIKVLISIKDVLVSIRHWGVRVIKGILRDPMAVYNLGYYLRKRLGRKTSVSNSAG